MGAANGGSGGGNIRTNGKGRETDAKVKKEQELLQQTLAQQQEALEMDRLWLEGRDTSKRDSSEDPVIKVRPHSVVNQRGKALLDIDDIIEKKLAKKTSPSPLRKSLPLDSSGFLPLPTHQNLSLSVSSPTLSAPPTDFPPVPNPPSGAVESKNSHDERNSSVLRQNSRTNPSEEPQIKTRPKSKAPETPPTENVDVVYQHTTSVVKSVIELNTGVQHAKPEEYVDLVKLVGLNLRDLLAAVDKEISHIPPELHREVEMAHRVLSSDMAELVSKMKIAQKYADTPLDDENRRNMLQAAQTLAIDSKNLYDTYSKLRDSEL